jgi:hypothetical protein
LVRPALPLGGTGIGPDVFRAVSDPDSNEDCRDEAIGDATSVTAGHTATAVFGMTVWRVFPGGKTRTFACLIPEKVVIWHRIALISFSPPMKKDQETMILNLRIGREQLENFEHVLTWYPLYGKKAYTPDSYLAEMIEQEYARVA